MNPTRKDAALKDELLVLENQYWQALQDRDVEAVKRLTDDTCIVTGAQGAGQLERARLEKMVVEATYTLRSFTIEDEAHAHRVTDDVAVLAYVVHEDLLVDGKQVSLDAADASTWVRRGDTWVCALHTESLLGDPFGRDRLDNPSRFS